MLSLAGLTAMLTRANVVTVRVADPVMVPEVALMAAVPSVRVLADPVAFTVATVCVSDDHVTMPVTSCVLPSLNVPVAVNCCVLLDASERFAGLTAIATKTAGFTVSAVDPAIAPELALIL